MDINSWYKKFKLAHYSEPEQKGEGRGGTGQFGDRRIEEWGGEHREEIARMIQHIENGYATKNWSGFDAYKEELMNVYSPPHNKQIVNSIVASAQGKAKMPKI
jgi:hypothetical protein